jgi:histidinol dehydrogenase
MQIIKYPQSNEYKLLTQRAVSETEEITAKVQSILQDVRRLGDEALRHFSKKFDKIELETFQVTPQEIAEAVSLVSDELKQAIQVAYQNITTFHKKQIADVEMVETTKGVTCWRKSVAIENVGIYIPGGTAPLFSTVLMLAIPAKIAGCRNIVLCSPPNLKGQIHEAILYAANLCGVTQIFKVGGAQAIAALAYGTASIPKVNKIFGPGNQYVTVAKQLVNTAGVAIDMPAGPSEVLVIGDANANADFIAADLLAQAEHGIDSQAIFVTDSEQKLQQVELAVQQQLAQLPRKEITQKALENSRLILFNNLAEGIKFSNLYAPEHLIIQTDNAEEWLPEIINAGSVFIGAYTPESAGDYASGTNHTLPTHGYAAAYSGVSLDSFVKKITFQKISKEGLQNIGKAIEIMAENEALFAHKNSVSVRLKEG